METNFEELEEVFESEGNLVTAEDPDRLVFVGDTHGDLQASRTVFDRYQDSDTTIVFLGDYVDRGPKSEENLNFLLKQKTKNPKGIYLLQGNHEGMMYREFGPVDFWSSLTPGKREKYETLLAKLPLVFSWRDLVAAHGGLPDVQSLEEIRQIEGGDSNWEKITWGDWNEVPGYILGGGFGRPQLGSDYFNQAMEHLEKEVLIRSHQPNVPTRTLNGRCITIFTSSAYGTSRKVAVVNRKVVSGDDVMLETL
ncbi:MAG: metallophosphoesterase family protein [Candidatus Acetothermia bacterium]